ncbi:von Willebrand factor type A domain-containing protein [Labedella gwakjiensis]|uniref:von Willebrand factor type A domain-containing protein n=2 Tax=Labedella gwakjiensis TaxID=390269 RepID=A0A2P8GYC4_9MICO|nr:VWA domain-containing protein [Labedella gwakjiensis]PSL38970.1 von Willebrand factor type A domain-containing protein [Labedella gwakjiensis]
MMLVNLWLVGAWIALAIIVVVLVFVLNRRRRRREGVAVHVAHSDRLTTLPGYAAALRRYRVLLAAVLIAATLLAAAAVLLSGRLVSLTTVQPEMRNRDIVLCLDVSGSMIDYDAQIVETFSQLTEEFDGERIGLVLFNASAVTSFPLTSDYAYAREQLDTLHADLVDPDTDWAFANGTLLGNGSSMIGDGLASCVMRFDDLDTERSRSIVFATDNYVAGEQIMTLPEAGEFAQSKDVVVFGLNPGDVDSLDYIGEFADEMREVVEGTGGTYWALEDPAAVPSIVEQVQARQAESFTGEPILVVTDEPTFPVLAGFAALAAVMFVGWRLRR